LKYSLSLLTLEAIGVIIDKWDCLLHPIQEKLGDVKSFFGLFLLKKYIRKTRIISIFLGAFS